MDEKDRIDKIMLNEKMNSAVFAQEIGIQGSTLSHILNGRNKPSLDVLKKILNRFRIINSDWLILGIGSMYRAEKQSQAPTLFDSIDENASISVNSYAKNDEKTDTVSSYIQPKKTLNPELTPQPVPEPHPGFMPIIESASKSVRKIIVYYTDNTFQEFETR